MISKIRHNLFLAGVKDINYASLKENKITAILNVSNETFSGSFTNIKIAKLGFSDNAVIAAKESQPAIDQLHQWLDAKETVLVHCRRGASRSPHIVATVLTTREKRSYQDIYEEIRKLHPRTLSYSIGQEIEDKNCNWLSKL